MWTSYQIHFVKEKGQKSWDKGRDILQLAPVFQIGLVWRETGLSTFEIGIWSCIRDTSWNYCSFPDIRAIFLGRIIINQHGLEWFHKTPTFWPFLWGIPTNGLWAHSVYLNNILKTSKSNKTCFLYTRMFSWEINPTPIHTPSHTPSHGGFQFI